MGQCLFILMCVKNPLISLESQAGKESNLESMGRMDSLSYSLFCISNLARDIYLGHLLG